MPRPLTQAYRCPQLAQLARQLVFAPADRRAEQVKRAERFHDQIDPEVDYPYEFVSYRITGFRGESEHQGLLAGDAVRDDLRILIDTLSKSAPVPAPEDEPVETTEQLASRLGVSTKTIQRWRRLGLRWRWIAPVERSTTPRRRGAVTGNRRAYAMSDAMPILVYPRASVERFLGDHADRVRHAGRFTRMPQQVRERIVKRAIRLARKTDATLNRLAGHLAARTGRGVETIRQLLLKHDRTSNEAPVFADRTATLTVRERRVIDRARRRGIGVTRMADRFETTRTTVYRVLLQRRLSALRRLPMHHIESPVFGRSDADAVLLRPGPLPDEASLRPVLASTVRLLAELPASLRPQFYADGIEASAQTSLAIRMNYLRFKASRACAEISRRNPRAGDINAVERLLADAFAIHQALMRANLRTVWSIARRHLADGAGLSRLLELILDAVPIAHQTIDEFDAAREHTVESYLAWSLMRLFARPQERAEASRAHRRPDTDALAVQIERAINEYRPAPARPTPSKAVSIDAERASIDAAAILRGWSNPDR